MALQINYHKLAQSNKWTRKQCYSVPPSVDLHQVIGIFCYEVSEDEVGDVYGALHQPHAVKVMGITIRVAWGRDCATSIFVYPSTRCI